ncbi:MAG: hypothetical protein AAB588_03545 [Patescibacteria group bacterium]
MNHSALHRILAISITILCGALIIPKVPLAYAHNQHFEIELRQNGKIIPVEDHAAKLKNEPFDLILILSEPFAVRVNASLQPKSYDDAKAGIPLTEIHGFQDAGRGMADTLLNPNKEIFIENDSINYLYYDGPKDHRFNRVSRKKGKIIGKRTIRQVVIVEPSGDHLGDITQPIKKLKGKTLYFVFANSKWIENYSKQEEYQRDFLKIDFK